MTEVVSSTSGYVPDALLDWLGFHGREAFNRIRQEQGTEAALDTVDIRGWLGPQGYERYSQVLQTQGREAALRAVSEEPDNSASNPEENHAFTPGGNVRFVKGKPVQFNAGIPVNLKSKSFYKAEYQGRLGQPMYKEGGFNEPGFIVRDFGINERLTEWTSGWSTNVEPWGFQFHFNPTTFTETFTPLMGLDYAAFIREIATSPVLTMSHQTGANITFEILLARREDQVILLQDNWQSFYEDPPDEEARKLILQKGTQYDIEHFFRTVNLDPILTWRDEYKTSDWGMMLGCPVVISFGDSDGCRKVRAQIQTMHISHLQYGPGMVPVYTKMSFQLIRIPDTYWQEGYTSTAGESGTADGGSTPSDGGATIPGGSVGSGKISGLDDEQSAIARRIAEKGQQKGVTKNGILAALTAGLQESRLRNLKYGHGTSLGVFQQIDTGWGDAAARTNVDHAIDAFYGGPTKPADVTSRGLLDIPNWEKMTPTELCQEVQQAGKNKAEEHYPEAKRIYNEIFSTPTDGGGASGDWETRAKSWTDAGIPYSQSKYHKNSYGNYRTDCSGFVSLVWGLSTSMVTSTLPQVSTKITKDQVKGGDIMNNVSSHVLIFHKWANDSKTEYWAYEMTPPKAKYHKIPWPYWRSGSGYAPYRKNGGMPGSSPEAPASTAPSGPSGKWIFPVPGYSINSARFHQRGPLWSCNKNSQGGLHTGVDIGAPLGTKIVAARGGTVRHTSYGGAYGPNQFMIVASDGSADFYAHTISRPANGASVKQGDAIAKVGALGNSSSSTAYHLHFEIHKKAGTYDCMNGMIDPAPKIGERG